MKINVNSITVVGVMWFTESQTFRPIGIIIGIDKYTNEYRAYIGTGDGKSELSDIQHIASFGAKFPVDQAKKLCGIID